MPLIPQPLINAAEIERINRELVGFIRHQLDRSYSLVMADPQAVLDALGTEAKTALMRYVVLHSALKLMDEAGDLANPNYDIFQPQDDGRVIYVAPPEPEPVVEPQPEPPAEQS